MDWINGLEKIDELPEPPKLLAAPKEEPKDSKPKKVFLTGEEREKWATAIVDSAIAEHKKQVGEFEIDMVCRQFMIDVLDHAYELAIEMPWSMYIRMVLNFLLLRMENQSNALMTAFMIGLAYSDMMAEDDLEDEPPEEQNG